jgi:hypothetical protein
VGQVGLDAGLSACTVGDPIAIAEYLGGGDEFDRSITDFSKRYADQRGRLSGSSWAPFGAEESGHATAYETEGGGAVGHPAGRLLRVCGRPPSDPPTAEGGRRGR